jgi:hypothetical protein
MERQFLRVVSTGVNGVAEDDVLRETVDFPGFWGFKREGAGASWFSAALIADGRAPEKCSQGSKLQRGYLPD